MSCKSLLIDSRSITFLLINCAISCFPFLMVKVFLFLFFVLQKLCQSEYLRPVWFFPMIYPLP